MRGAATSHPHRQNTPGRPTWGARGASARLIQVGLGTGGLFTLELLGKGLGGAVDGNHVSLSRSMAPIQKDKDSILWDMYQDKTGRQQGRQMMKQTGNKAVKERRRAVASRK